MLGKGLNESTANHSCNSGSQLVNILLFSTRKEITTTVSDISKASSFKEAVIATIKCVKDISITVVSLLSEF